MLHSQSLPTNSCLLSRAVEVGFTSQGRGSRASDVTEEETMMNKGAGGQMFVEKASCVSVRIHPPSCRTIAALKADDSSSELEL